MFSYEHQLIVYHPRSLSPSVQFIFPNLCLKEIKGYESDTWLANMIIDLVFDFLRIINDAVL